MNRVMTWSVGVRQLVFLGDAFFVAGRCLPAEVYWQKALKWASGEEAAAIRIKLAGLYQRQGSRAQWQRYLADAIEALAKAKGAASPLVAELKRYLAGKQGLAAAVLPRDMDELHALAS